MPRAPGSPDETEGVPKKRRWRFSLATLILGTALGLAILANYLQYRDIQREKQFLKRRHSAMSDELNGLLQHAEQFNRIAESDESRICVSQVPTGSEEEWMWQIVMPHYETYDICFGVEGIPGDGIPTKWAWRIPATGPTWVKVRLDPPCPCNRNQTPNNRAVECAVYSFRRPYVYDPTGRHGISRPFFHCCALPAERHVWSVTGQGQRETFPLDQPPVLLRMRAMELEMANSEEADIPGPGFMIWLERATQK